MKKEKPDTTQMGDSHEKLADAKKQEKKMRRKLKRVPILHGYVMALNPSKWDAHKVNTVKNGNTRLSNRKAAKAHKDGG